MGRMTASFNASFAPSRPATSSHLTFGLSDRIAPVEAFQFKFRLKKVLSFLPDKPDRSFFNSGSSPSPSSLLRVHAEGQYRTAVEGVEDGLLLRITAPVGSHGLPR